VSPAAAIAVAAMMEEIEAIELKQVMCRLVNRLNLRLFNVLKQIRVAIL
jgi:hypothetical protein